MPNHVVSLPVADCPITAAVRHRLWTPPPSQSPLVEWWRPLVGYARRCRLDEFPWAIYIEDFDFLGSVARDRLPTVSIYRHHAGGGELCLGPDGQAFRFAWASGGRSAGRFIECELRTALWRADLPTYLDTVWFDRATPWDDDVVPEIDDPTPEPLAPVRRLRGL